MKDDNWSFKQSREPPISIESTIRAAVYEIEFKDILPENAALYLALPPELVKDILVQIGAGIVSAYVYDKIIKPQIEEKKKNKPQWFNEHFKKIAISGTNKKDGSLAVYNISKSIKLGSYQNLVIVGIEGTPVLDFTSMDPTESCFKVGFGSFLYLKNLKIIKYDSQRLFEGDGKVIYEDDVKVINKKGDTK
ncbi:hypothetical protein [Pyrococcus kukulkanii]|uniref:Uncharacterized protein n=1 Tax=Pyrococcus kukulkanii TaxID=1609559 RepID=A0A127B7Z5_9EURY|nr:hypothetical protein [Pyrococcus kukulkanii]AMM53501.1 hypothetical protein TQ32_02600 [Pyrococcus kukulkanii]